MKLHRACRRGTNFVECLFSLGMIQGAIGGAVYGWREYGWLGALLGIPVGGMAGWLTLAAFMLIVFAAIWSGGTIYLLFTEGRREAWRFLIHGPRMADRLERPPTAEEAERIQELGREPER